MPDYILFLDPKTRKELLINITNSPSQKEVYDFVRELPKDEQTNKSKFGGLLIHVWGFTNIKINEKETR